MSLDDEVFYIWMFRNTNAPSVRKPFGISRPHIYCQIGPIKFAQFLETLKHATITPYVLF